jgi:hypothetical protein
MRTVAVLLVAIAAPSVTGCASFEGQPRPVISVGMSEQVLKEYEVPAILRKYGGLSGRAQRAYRNEVIGVYVQAIDARYDEFTANLSTENKGTNLGFDTLLIGLVGAAALSPTDAADIAAVTTGVIGLRGSIDKNLYYERTLPALVAAMDAERYRVRTSIEGHKADDTSEYPLASALVELQEYQQAGSLLRAISAVTDAAAADRRDAKQDFERLTRFSCESEDAVNVAVDPVGDFLSALYMEAEADAASTAALNKLRLTADVFGINGAGTMNVMQLETAIDNALLGGFCTIDEVNELKTRLQGARVGFTVN